jgi:hypothetical protein
MVALLLFPLLTQTFCPNLIGVGEWTRRKPVPSDPGADALGKSLDFCLLHHGFVLHPTKLCRFDRVYQLLTHAVRVFDTTHFPRWLPFSLIGAHRNGQTPPRPVPHLIGLFVALHKPTVVKF